MSNDKPRINSGNGPEYVYEGSELELFERCVQWKSYLRRQLHEHIRGDVLEVGAGIGATTRCLCDGRQTSWVALEPDATMSRELEVKFAADPLPIPVEVACGTLATFDAQRRFDAVLYIDVLEHIEADREELRRATSFLKPGGEIVVLAPAHGWLYSDFDRAIGHHRRYNAKKLRGLRPEGVTEVRMLYLDAVGLLALLGNRFLLRASLPTPGQLRFWDSVLVRTSRCVDPLLGHRLGKAIVAVWRVAP
jgi:SAM-dependent methyltransferase